MNVEVMLDGDDLAFLLEDLWQEPVPEPEPEVEEPRRPSRKELKRRTKERNDARKFKAWRTSQAE